jgi:hypothetical protein
VVDGHVRPTVDSLPMASSPQGFVWTGAAGLVLGGLALLRIKSWWHHELLTNFGSPRKERARLATSSAIFLGALVVFMAGLTGDGEVGAPWMLPLLKALTVICGLTVVLALSARWFGWPEFVIAPRLRRGWTPPEGSDDGEENDDAGLYTGVVDNGTETRIVVERPITARDRLRKYVIEVDGVDAGRLASGETQTFSVTPGEHKVRARISWTGSREVSVDLAQGSVVYLMVTPAAGNPMETALTHSGYLDLTVRKQRGRSGSG